MESIMETLAAAWPHILAAVAAVVAGLQAYRRRLAELERDEAGHAREQAEAEGDEVVRDAWAGADRAEAERDELEEALRSALYAVDGYEGVGRAIQEEAVTRGVADLTERIYRAEVGGPDDDDEDE